MSSYLGMCCLLFGRSIALWALDRLVVSCVALLLRSCGKTRNPCFPCRCFRGCALCAFAGVPPLYCLSRRVGSGPVVLSIGAGFLLPGCRELCELNYAR